MSELQSGDSLRERRRRRLAAEIERIAVRLFGERGYHAVTVQDIAAAADISPRTFFRYFTNKEDVLLVAQRRRAEQLHEALATRPPDEPAFTALRNAILSEAPDFENDRETVVLRAKIFEETPGLLARDLGVQASLMQPLINMVAIRLGTDPDTDLRPGVLVGSALAATLFALGVWIDRGGEGELQGLIAEALVMLEIGFQRIGDQADAINRTRPKSAW